MEYKMLYLQVKMVNTWIKHNSESWAVLNTNFNFNLYYSFFITGTM